MLDPRDNQTGVRLSNCQDFYHFHITIIISFFYLQINQRKSRQEAFRVANDSRYYFCVVFQSAEQKEEFLKKAEWEDLGTDFLNGLDVAKRLEIDVKYIAVEASTTRGNIKRFKGLTIK
jgi:hypothetical protein